MGDQCLHGALVGARFITGVSGFSPAGHLCPPTCAGNEAEEPWGVRCGREVGTHFVLRLKTSRTYSCGGLLSRSLVSSFLCVFFSYFLFITSFSHFHYLLLFFHSTFSHFYNYFPRLPPVNLLLYYIFCLFSFVRFFSSSLISFFSQHPSHSRLASSFSFILPHSKFINTRGKIL